MPFYPDKARINPNDPQRTAQCARCGDVHNLEDLVPQFQWAGMQLINTNLYVCTSRPCLDIPNPQQRTIILPPDPPPTFLARQINFPLAENSYITSEDGTPILNETLNLYIVPEGDGNH